MRNVFVFAIALIAATSAADNDATASVGAGGLVLKHTDAIDMLSEDLFVSADAIRVHYVFRNRTNKDIETVVAFPLPDRDLADEYASNVSRPSDFRTNVAGRRVKAQLERKARVAGKDFRAMLTQLHIPIAPASIDDASKAMDRLAPSLRKRLQSLGLAREEEWDDDGKGMKHHLVPLWTVKDKYWWVQHFPANTDLPVDHDYVPGTGGSVENPIASPSLRKDKYTLAMIERYCVDRPFLAAVERKSSKDPDLGPQMPDKKVDYILTTGANWRSPIGSFRLVVDKGKPGNLVSFCETGVTKISPTQFEVRHSNWTPTRDLNVLIIEPQN